MIKWIQPYKRKVPEPVMVSPAVYGQPAGYCGIGSQPNVEVHWWIGNLSTKLHMAPDDARAFAARLIEAADKAEAPKLYTNVDGMLAMRAVKPAEEEE